MRALLLVFVLACGTKNSSPPTQPAPPPNQAGECVKSGCSGTVCTEPGNDVVTTCEFKPEYACYDSATCTRQSDGKCGWTQTPELAACLKNPPPAK